MRCTCRSELHPSGVVLGEQAGSAAIPAWPDLLLPLCFPALLSNICCLSLHVKSCSGRAEQSPGGLAGEGAVQSRQREFPPLLCPALPPAQPGAVLQLQRLQQMERLPCCWRHCYKFPVPWELAATQGTGNGSFWPFSVSMEKPGFGARVRLWVL